MPDQNATPERGYQITAMTRQLHAVVTQLRDQMNLRQWAVEKVVEICVASGVNAPPMSALKEIVEYFHDFVDKPAADALASIEAKPVDAA